jgi:hypothetical protein
MALLSLLYMGKLSIFVWAAPQQVVRVLELSGRLAAQLINYLPYLQV